MTGTCIARQQRTDAPRTSELIFSELEAAARNERRKASLDRVRKACDDLEQKGLKIGPASVGKRIAEQHRDKLGPIAQSISNDSAGLAKYVSARERERLATSNQEAGKPARSGVQEILRLVSNGDVRNAVMDLDERCRAAEKTVEHARRLLSSLNPGANLEALASGDASRILPSSQPAVSNAQVHGLRSLLTLLGDPRLLGEFRLKCDASGGIRREGGLNDEMIPGALIQTLGEVVSTLESAVRRPGTS